MSYGTYLEVTNNEFFSTDHDTKAILQFISIETVCLFQFSAFYKCLCASVKFS